MKTFIRIASGTFYVAAVAGLLCNAAACVIDGSHFTAALCLVVSGIASAVPFVMLTDI